MDKQPSLPLWKNLLFGAITLIIFLGGIELSLSLFDVKPLLVSRDPFVGFAANIPLFVEHVQPDGTVMLVTAENKVPAFNAQQFPKVKSKNTYRIFCMGGSTTYGHPFSDPVSFCGWLREFLKSTDPSVNWEVINAGGVSYASYRVANLMNELSQYQPDMFIVYCGQNEFLEERTYRNVKKMPDWFMRAVALLSRTRTYTVMNKALDRITDRQTDEAKKRFTMGAEVKEILNNTVGPTSYRRDDVLKGQIRDHYKLELKRMIEIAQSSGSKVVFVTPASNLKDIPPFKSELRADMTDAEKRSWNTRYIEGKKHQEAGELDKALSIFNEMLKMDNRYAEIHFRIGRLLFDLGRFDEAKVSFQKAIDEDICPLRILSPMSKDLRDVAKENNVPIIDFVKLLEDDCHRNHGHGIPGNEYFLDHVHPTIDGYRMLGFSLLELLVKQNIAKPGSVLNDAEIASVVRKVEQRITPEARVLALRILAKTIDWTGMLDKGRDLLLQAAKLQKGDRGGVFVELATNAIRRGKIDDALNYYGKALMFWPDNLEIHDDMAYHLDGKGKQREALAHYYEVIRISKAEMRALKGSTELNPKSANYMKYFAVAQKKLNAHNKIAHILSTQGHTGEAISHYREVLALRPNDDSASTNIGVLLARSGNDSEAVPYFMSAIRINPNSSNAHYNLGIILEKQGKIEDAINHFSAVLKIQPDSADARNNLGIALTKQGNIDRAISLFSEALKINSNSVEAHYNLGLALAMKGRKEESDFHLSEAKRIRATLTAAKPGAGN